MSTAEERIEAIEESSPIPTPEAAASMHALAKELEVEGDFVGAAEAEDEAEAADEFVAILGLVGG